MIGEPSFNKFASVTITNISHIYTRDPWTLPIRFSTDRNVVRILMRSNLAEWPTCPEGVRL